MLNQSYEPISICSAKKAQLLLYLTKAEMVAKSDGRVIRTVQKNYPLPSVIKLSRYLRLPYKRVELSRRNILRRDSHTCQYCGSHSELTVDHVIPKSRAGSDSWENLITACRKCNNKKGNRTPEEAKMPMRKKPEKPHYILFFKQTAGNVEDSWRPFLFMD